MPRRVAIASAVLIAFVVGVAVGRAGGQGKPRMWADVVLDLVTDELPRRTRVHTNLDHWEPKAETGRHTHPGPESGYLLEGEFTLLVEGQPPWSSRLVIPRLAGAVISGAASRRDYSCRS